MPAATNAWLRRITGQSPNLLSRCLLSDSSVPTSSCARRHGCPFGTENAKGRAMCIGMPEAGRVRAFFKNYFNGIDTRA